MTEFIKKHLKKIIVVILGLFTLTAAAATVLMVPQGGTGISSVTSGSYLKGAGTAALVARTPTEVKTDLGLGATNVPTFGGLKLGGLGMDNESVIRSFVNQSSGKSVYYFDFTTYDMFATSVSGTGSVDQSLGLAASRTGTTAGSYGRQNLNAQETYISGIYSGRTYLSDATTNFIAFWGIGRTLLTTETTHAQTFIHAGFWYNNGEWYASNADGTAQTTTALGLSAGVKVFRINGSQSGNIYFYANDVLVANHTTNISGSYGYMQWYINNKALSSNKVLYFYNHIHAN